MPYPANGRPYTSGMRSSSQSVIKRQKVSQGEAPNPVVFVATKDTRSVSVCVGGGGLGLGYPKPEIKLVKKKKS